MKQKLLLLTLCLGTLGGAYAQDSTQVEKRKIDMEAYFTEPQSGVTYHKDSIPLTLMIKNLGPDAFKRGDTFVIQMGSNFYLNNFKTDVPLNGTYTIMTGRMAVPNTGEQTTCIYVYEDLSKLVYNDGTKVSVTWIDEDSTNNIPCVTYIARDGGQTSIEDVVTSSGFEIYPTPAKDYIHIKALQSIESIALIDQLGRSHLLSSQFLQNEARVYVGDYTPGNYILSIRTVDGVIQNRQILIIHP